MSPEKYKRVKEIFLAACQKPGDRQADFVAQSCAGDEEVKREVEGLLREHQRETQILPSEPESPVGSMSSLLSRAQLELGGQAKAAPAAGPVAQAPPAGERHHSQHRESIGGFPDDSSAGGDSGSGFIDAGRFMAGTIVAGRYRIIELLGRGGMGEVYRADDLTLNQSLALKFLPTLFSSDEKWLERFRTEVRLARQVTHPNVCRVFDIGEFQGEQFISMEYVDGENLASLLRRIGRLPQDKALQIARQLCAGLAAAHDRGVLHRDLKPANVMIDGRGSVRITDFGLAVPSNQMPKDAVRAGTPAYMSPEQLAGKGVTVRSDVYSLGLLLYEMFTGRRAFKGTTLRDYQKLHSSEDPTPPSQVLENIDPIVERVILKCLEKDPKNRPASAMAVSASLPGGDPLREILAAGETPSPEVVAAAGSTHGGLRLRDAGAFLVMGVLSIILVALLAPQAFLIQLAVSDKSPAVLADKAATLLHDRLGYPQARDRAEGFSLNVPYYRQVQQTQHTPDRWKALLGPDPGMVQFWYREAADLLVPLQPGIDVQENDPPPIRPGDVCVTLDPQGRLVDFEAQPLKGGPQSWRPPQRMAVPDTAQSPAAAAVPAWASPLLHAADLEHQTLTPVPPSGVPPVFADERAAWTTTLGREPLHIEAAALNGRPVYFAILGSRKGEKFTSVHAEQLSLSGVNDYVRLLLNLSLLSAGAILAWRNYRSGRSDRAGAMRMAIAFFGFGLVAWLLRAHHVPDILEEFSLFTRAAGAILYPVCLIWIYYLALEPYIRRIWPETVISWNRLLTGKWLDPLVGRDVLIGGAVGAFTVVLQALDMLLPRWLGYPAPFLQVYFANRMLSSVDDFSALFSGAIGALYVALILLLMLVLLRMALRHKLAVALAFLTLYVAATARWEDVDYITFAMQALTGVLFLALLTRRGLVALIFCLVVRNLLTEFPVSSDLSVWYANTTMVAVGCAIVLLGLSFYASIGGRAPAALRPGET